MYHDITDHIKEVQTMLLRYVSIKYRFTVLKAVEVNVLKFNIEFEHMHAFVI